MTTRVRLLALTVSDPLAPPFVNLINPGKLSVFTSRFIIVSSYLTLDEPSFEIRTLLMTLRPGMSWLGENTCWRCERRLRRFFLGGGMIGGRVWGAAVDSGSTEDMGDWRKEGRKEAWRDAI